MIPSSLTLLSRSTRDRSSLPVARSCALDRRGRFVIGACGFGLRRLLRAAGDVGDDVADVDHAARVVERIAIDRHARMARFLELVQQFAERDVDVDGLDVGARHHDVLDAQFAQPEDVVEHRAFFGREGPLVRARAAQALRSGLANRCRRDGRKQLHETPKASLIVWRVRADRYGAGCVLLCGSSRRVVGRRRRQPVVRRHRSVVRGSSCRSSRIGIRIGIGIGQVGKNASLQPSPSRRASASVM